MEEKSGKQASVKDSSVRNSRANLFAYVFSNEAALVDLGDIVVTAKVVDIRFDSLPKEKALGEVAFPLNYAIIDTVQGGARSA